MEDRRYNVTHDGSGHELELIVVPHDDIEGAPFVLGIFRDLDTGENREQLVALRPNLHEKTIDRRLTSCDLRTVCPQHLLA